MRDPSTFCVLQADLGVNDWVERYDGRPPVDLIRPNVTRCCGRQSRPLDGSLVLHGHGTRPRSVAGLTTMPDSIAAERLASKSVEFRVRRYLCVVCDRTMTVVPREVRPHAEILVSTVILALGVWAYHPDSPATEVVRNWVLGRNEDSAPGWRQLRRWASATDMLGGRRVDKRLSPKRRAAQIVQILAARSPPETRGESLTKRGLEPFSGRPFEGNDSPVFRATEPTIWVGMHPPNIWVIPDGHRNLAVHFDEMEQR